MSRLSHAWSALSPSQRPAVIASVCLLITMFLPWYELESIDHHTGAIHSRAISAFGDVSFVEAAIFLVAAGVITMLLARAEGRSFQMPGGDGTVVMVAGGWAGLLIFYRVFSRPPGDGLPVGIEWGFFLAFVAAGALAYTGWRMRAAERPQPPLRRSSRERSGPEPRRAAEPERDTQQRARPVPARPRPARAEEPPEQLSFEDPPPRPRLPPAPGERD